MATHLRRLGHEVLVITSSVAGRIDGETEVIRTPDLMSSPALRRVLGARPTSRDSPPGYLAPTPHERILVPDPKLVGWVPGALAAARRVLSRQPIDCLITTSPFESTHLIGLALGRRRPPWVVDLRDGWTFDPWKPALPLPAQRRLDAWLERLVLHHADAVAASPRAVAADVRRRFGRAAYHIGDGWDPELEPQLARVQGPRANSSLVILAYTGTLWRADGQDPTPVLEALRRIRAANHGRGGQLELVVAGPLSSVEARRLREHCPDGAVRHVGFLPRIEAVALQRTADALLLIGSHQRDVVTGKLFEYLAAGRPIVTLPDDNEAAAIVRETGTGVAVPLANPGAIERALCDVVTGKLRESYRPRGLAAYRYPAPARAMLDVVWEAINLGLGRLAG